MLVPDASVPETDNSLRVWDCARLDVSVNRHVVAPYSDTSAQRRRARRCYRGTIQMFLNRTGLA